MEASGKKWYDRRWLVIVLLTFFFPVGYYALYKNRRMRRVSKILVGCLFASVIIGVLGGDGAEEGQPPSTESENTEQNVPAEGGTEPSAQPTPAPQTTEESPPEESSSQADGRVTMAKYKEVETGMSYSQVRKIIGSEGEELSRNEIGGNVTVMYQWTNPFGSNMNAMFQNGDLIQKAQFGLD